MPPLDATAPIPDISPDQPAGENLEFDPAFIDLERLAAGKPEQQYGSTIVPAEEPEWKLVVAAAWDLTARTYDLRVLAQLAVARLHHEGLPAYAETAALIRQALETRWAAVHPQLDPDDDNDPTLRGNALLAIADPVRVLRLLRNMPLARSARAGAVSWRDISIAAGTIEVDDSTTKPTTAVIDAAFRESDPAAMDTLRAAIASAIASAVAIPAAFDENAGYGTGPDFADVTKLLRDMQRMIDNHAQAQPEPEADTSLAPDPAAGDPGLVQPGNPGTAPARSTPVASIATMGPPTNRTDAMRLLDLVIEFYERNEPSSPLPLLIARARRLADKGFLDIIKDMAPDGLTQAQLVAGTSPESY